MVIHYFDVVSIRAFPDETNSPLIVNADAVLTFSFASELLEMIGGRNT